MSKTSIVSITTDFGLRDGYVGIIKGVILGICPGAVLVDLSHEVSPGDLVHAGLILERAIDFFPPGTVHLAVVDPGVGTERSPIAACTGKGYFVGPDNGLFTLPFRKNPPVKIVTITNAEFFLSPLSRTFHGRDIFAPVAAHLAYGVPLESFGEEASDWQKITIPEPVVSGDEIHGEVIQVDHFGNLITNIPRSFLSHDPVGLVITIGDRIIQGVSDTYGNRRKGELMAVVGSFERLEIAVNGGSAFEVLGVNRETSVRVIVAKLWQI